MRINDRLIPKVIMYIYFILAFLLPLTFFTKTSEIFEFNKMVLIYASTTLITALYLSNIVISKKFKFTKNSLTYSIVIFLASMSLSTLISIDIRTSLFGYYSRFHGGLTSYISYVLLFYIFVEIFNKKQILQLIKVLIFSTLLASVYAGLEHFGYSPSCLFVTKEFNVDCWVQDVQNRVFGTFGQPNWLAAWLTAIIPLTLYLSLKNSFKTSSAYFLAFCLMSITIYFTKSRSGFIAYLVSLFTFGAFSLYIYKDNFKKIFKFLIIIFAFVLSITLLIKTPWKPTINIASAQEYSPPALEVGGTESGSIRKIVWRGAWNLFLKYPLLGTGLDTFAYSYYETRPIEHNLVSEWNFIYNRAHNEYLNFLSTTGMIGFVSYIILIAAILYVFIKKFSLLNISLLSSFVAILITNFFGFSTVSIGFLFFILPAISLANEKKQLETKIDGKNIEIKNNQRYVLLLIIAVAVYSLFLIHKYWQADYIYAKAKGTERLGDSELAVKQFEKAIQLNNNEANFHNELSKAYLSLDNFENSALTIDKALSLSPHNVAIHKQAASTYSKMSTVNKEYALKEAQIIEKLLDLAPTDPSVQYKYASLLARNGLIDESITELKKAIEMKPNYKIANVLLAYIYEDIGEKELAEKQYKYILKYIDPNDEKIKEDLNSLDL